MGTYYMMKNQFKILTKAVLGNRFIRAFIQNRFLRNLSIVIFVFGLFLFILLNYPESAIGQFIRSVLAVIALVVLIWGFVSHKSKPVVCTQCSMPIIKVSYEYELNGESVCLCPNCNRKLRKTVSDVSFRR